MNNSSTSILNEGDYDRVAEGSTDTTSSIIKATTEAVLQGSFVDTLKKENKSLKSQNTRLTNENSNLKGQNIKLDSNLENCKDKYSTKNVVCGLLNIIAAICIAAGVNFLTSNPPNALGSTFLTGGVIANILSILVLYFLSK